MKRERSLLVALAMAGAMVLGLGGTSSAVLVEDGFSYTQPAAELVMPYSTLEDRVTFLVASNISGRQVTTHWVFWNETCSEAIDFSICLTPNDTVVVDPRDMGAQGADNERLGPKISLTGVRGVVTVVAYETDAKCAPYTSTSSIADDSIVGSFTLAATDVGYSIGNDAFGLGTVGGKVQVPQPEPGNDFEFSLQTFNPSTVDDSVVILTHIAESGDVVVPGTPALRLSTSFVDTTEIPTSLPDKEVRCTKFFTVTGGDSPLIPDTTTVATSGIVRLQPKSGLVNGTTYLYGIVGQAVEKYGASSSVKVEQVEGSASPAFIDGMSKGLF